MKKRHTRWSTCLWAVITGLALAAASTAGAELLIYEPFDYPLGNVIIGQSGGSEVGLDAAAWSVNVEPTTPGVYTD